MDITTINLALLVLSLTISGIAFIAIIVAMRAANNLRIESAGYVERQIDRATSTLLTEVRNGKKSLIRRREGRTPEIAEDSDALREQFIASIVGSTDSEQTDDTSDCDEPEDPLVLLERYPSTWKEEALSRVTLDPKAELAHYLDYIYGTCDEILELRNEPSTPEVVESLKELDEELDSLMGHYGAMWRESMIRY